MGDFNAKIGPNNTGLRSVMGQHGTGTRNDNGERLVELCRLFQLLIGATIFPHKNVHKYSWTSPSAITRNQIDHICISRKWRHSLLDVRNKRGAAIDSDHELVIGELSIKLNRNHSRNTGNSQYRRAPPLNLHLLSDSTLKTRITSTLREQLIPLEDHPWEHTCRQLRTTAEEILGLQQRGRSDWISEGTSWDLIRRRNHLKPLANQLTQYREEYHGLCRAVKRSARKDKRAQQDRLAAGAERAAGENNMRSLYTLYTVHRNPSQTELTSQRSRSHTTSPNVAIDYRSVVPPSGSSRIPSAPPNVREIVNAIKKLNHNRAAGEDNIPAELLQVDTQLMAEILHPHFSRIWEGETEKIEPSIRDEQAGFRPHRSCVDHANTLRIITEQAVEWRAPLYVLFIDFKKAFDSVERAAIWRALASKGVPANLIAIIKSMYDDANLAVLHNGKTSAPFQTNTGIRQGCPLSPLLFNIVVDELMSEVCSSKRGITWNLTKHLEDLDYADDICLISHRLDDIQRKSGDLVRITSSVGLEINIAKTKAMRFNHSSQGNININGNPIEFITSFPYLGTIISNSGGVDDDVFSRLGKARSAFGRLYCIWKDRQISRRTKLRIYNACVKSILLYGSETWDTPRRK
ncbi:uncharacterized protein LOC122319632 [Drosophila yakuba]|uniref:uncharacterized protein LOC122319632 n=1 Tax=Drosophila yakuba TaxID=7245 RepID=UPI001C8B03B3|nr:uncharacterized protein LOC122319632 [Drosophila yakuba]